MTKVLGTSPAKAIVRLASKSRRYNGAPHGEAGGIDVDPMVASEAVGILVEQYPEYTPPHLMAEDKLAKRRPGVYVSAMVKLGFRPARLFS